MLIFPCDLFGAKTSKNKAEIALQIKITIITKETATLFNLGLTIIIYKLMDLILE